MKPVMPVSPLPSPTPRGEEDLVSLREFHVKYSLFITGATSGIGLALARYYLERGARVGVVARRTELLQSLADEFPQQLYSYPVDVRDTDGMQAAARNFIERVGEPDIVIANAGVSTGTLTEYAEDTIAFQQVMDINVLGMVKTFQPFLAGMQARGRGTLVGIASVAGFRGLPGAGAYSASKAAVISYLESLRVEMHGSGVKVVTICPGYIKTPMTVNNPYPMPFILEVDEAAARMVRAIARQTAFTVIPWQMGLLGRVLKILPRWLYDRLFAGAPHKPRRQ